MTKAETFYDAIIIKFATLIVYKHRELNFFSRLLAKIILSPVYKQRKIQVSGDSDQPPIAKQKKWPPG